MDEERKVRRKVFPPPTLGILCHEFECLGFGGKECSSIHMNKVLKEQRGLGGSIWKKRHFPGSLQMVLEKAEKRCDRTLTLKRHPDCR